jgi:hypothetical protein
MAGVEVRNRNELQAALNGKAKEIVLKGELAEKVLKAKKIGKLNKIGLGLLIGLVGTAALTAPVTGGISLALAGVAAAVTGVEVAAIIAASLVGIALIVAVFKEYDQVHYKDGELILKRKGSD